MDIPKDVTDNLYSGENVIYCIKKKIALELKPRYLVITDRRVIYYDQKIAGRYDLHDIPYSKLERVYFNEGIIASEFALKDEENHQILLTWLDKTECKDAIIRYEMRLIQLQLNPCPFRKRKH